MGGLGSIDCAIRGNSANAKKSDYEDPCLPQTTAPRPAPKIATGNSIYVYNFLDIRWKEYTPKVLDAIEAKLLSCLNNHNQKIFITRSAQTPFSTQNSEWRSNYSADQQTANIPVGPIIESNLKNEERTGTSHRLIIFPSNFTISGAWRFYSIRWVLFSASGEEIWGYEYEGRHMAMWSNSENSESRAKKVIDAAVIEMRKNNIF